jgi:hypothetical protein
VPFSSSDEYFRPGEHFWQSEQQFPLAQKDLETGGY